LPHHIRQFLDEILLHDALVLDISRRGGEFIIILRKDIPPKDDVTLIYTLAAEPIINTEAITPKHRSAVMEYMYDEFDLVKESDGNSFMHSILFSYGWEFHLHFTDWRFVIAKQFSPVASSASEILQPP